MKLRRVVTGHDARGKAVVKIDELCTNVLSRRPQHSSGVVWTTDSVPADASDERDGAARQVATSDPRGTVFRVVQYEPGVAPRRHRTASLDYAVVVSGEIDMELDDGVVVHLKQGDTLVQRATIHNWVNRGTQPCVIAFVLVAAKGVQDAVG
jgi:oxalate decarboxylase/phosphoglucose isomerase-like protein (cupin superfamily)